MLHLELPQYAQLGDSELMAFEGKEFAEKLIGRAKTFGQFVLSRSHYDLEEFEPEERKRRLAEWTRGHAWVEWWLGVVPPSKQLLAFPDTEVGLKVLLAQQVIDEVKHQRIFSKRARLLGGNPRFESFEPSETLKGLYDSTVACEDPLDIAASLQLSGEAVLLGHVDPENSIVPLIVDEETLDQMVHEIIPEEPRHVHNGQIIVSRWADTPQKRRRCCEIQNRKLHALLEHYRRDHALLGAHMKEVVIDIA